MTFEGLVDRLTSLFDVDQTRAVDVANERLSTMVSDAKSLKAIISLGVTVADQARYTLLATVVHIYKVMLAEDDTFPNSNVLPPDDAVPGTNSSVYEGNVSIEDLWDVSVGLATISGTQNVFAIEPNADGDMNTEAVRLYPAPATAGMGIIALVALRPTTLTYTAATALPIPVNAHPALLAGCEAILMDEEGRQDEAAKKGSEFAAGVRVLEGGTTSRGKGSGRHRPRMVGYDVPLT